MKTIVLAATFVLAGISLSVAQGNKPIEVSGFNVDGIADGSYKSAASVTDSTSDKLDNNGNVFYQKGFNPDGGKSEVGLPAGQSFASDANANTTFALQPATGKNLLLLRNTGTTEPRGVSTGTLSLTTPRVYASLAFLVTGFDGTDIDVSYQLTFEDGKTTVGKFLVKDNFDGSSPALSGFDRVDTQGNFGGSDPSNPRLYEMDVSLAKADQGHALKSVTFTNNNTESGTNVAVFAISGEVIEKKGK